MSNPGETNTLEMQMNALKETVVYCAKHSPFYKTQFAKIGLDANTFKGIEDLQKIPFTTKEDLQINNAAFLCVPNQKVADYSSTSGTLGDPIFIALTASDLERLALNESKSFLGAGLKAGDVVQLMTTMDRRFMAGLAYYLGVQKLGGTIIRVGSGLPELQWDTIQSLKPTAIVAVPSFIVKLIEFAQEHDLPLQASSVKKAICIGEPIRDANLELNALGKRITDAWDIQLFSTYASTEMGAAFTECEQGQGGHLVPELIYAELVDEDGQTVKKGALGELVVTTLGVEGMPVLRYKTGDICRAIDTPCPCGNPSLRLGPIVGRKKHMIKYKGTTFYPPALFNTLNDFEEITNYLVELSTSSEGTDELNVKICSKNTSDQFLDKINAHFRAKLRVSPQVEFIDSAELHQLQAPEKNRKPIKFIDHRKV